MPKQVDSRPTSNFDPSSPAAIQQAFVEAGDIDGLLDHIQHRGLWLEVFPGVWKNIRDALKNFTGTTEEMIDWTFRRVLEFDLQLLVRTHVVIDDELHGIGSRSPAFERDLPPDVAERWLPRLQRIEDRIVHLSTAYAKVKATLTRCREQAKSNSARIVRLPAFGSEEDALLIAEPAG